MAYVRTAKPLKCHVRKALDHITALPSCPGHLLHGQSYARAELPQYALTPLLFGLLSIAPEAKPLFSEDPLTGLLLVEELLEALP